MPERSSPLTIVAFDFGLRRIGVAVGQDVTGSASPLGVIKNGENGPDFDSIAALVKEWRPNRLVVGLPLHADGSPGDLEPTIAAFIADLQKFNVPIDRIDERHTSQEAEEVLKTARQSGSRGRIRKEDIDAAAAVFIAERYLLKNL
jgi:putative Holliday junction resolvase